MKNLDNFRKIFKEFYELSYKDTIPKLEQCFKDTKISDYIILRQSNSGNCVHYLYNGSSFIVPIKWVHLFSSLNVHSGDKIIRNWKLIDSEDIVSKIGFYLTYLIYITDLLGTRDVGDDILNTISRIITIGTEEFRLWVHSEFNLSLEPLEYKSLDDIINI